MTPSEHTKHNPTDITFAFIIFVICISPLSFIVHCNCCSLYYDVRLRMTSYAETWSLFVV